MFHPPRYPHPADITQNPHHLPNHDQPSFSPYADPATNQSTPQRSWATDNPIYDPTSPQMACNNPGAPGPTTARVAAGSTVTAYWSNPWLHSIGPVVTWMAQLPPGSPTDNAAAAAAAPPPGGRAWFKLDQAGLLAGDLPTGLWGMGVMMDGNSSWTSTVPAALRPGRYLLRNEVIAMHQPGRPQFYMQWVLHYSRSSPFSPPPPPPAFQARCSRLLCVGSPCHR